MGLFDRWFGGEKAAPAALPDDAVMFANDVVLSALIGPPGAPVEEFLARAARGEVTPVVCDATLYWTWCAVEPGDTIDFARFATLLRYARIVPLQDGGAARSEFGWTPPSDEEKAHWRDVVFGRQEEEAEDAGPGVGSFLCSRCYQTHAIGEIRVIPWWNTDARDVVTTYRCASCWLPSLEETRAAVESPAFDAAMRARFVAFLEGHQRADVAAAVAREGAAPLVAFLAQVRSGAVVLRP